MDESRFVVPTPPVKPNLWCAPPAGRYFPATAYHSPIMKMALWSGVHPFCVLRRKGGRPPTQTAQPSRREESKIAQGEVRGADGTLGPQTQLTPRPVGA